MFFSAYKIISSEIGYAEDIDVSFRCSVNILEGMELYKKNLLSLSSLKRKR